MKILIVGASRGTGALAVREALNRGHSVTAFSRNPQSLMIDSPQLTRASGSFHEPASVRAVVPGHDAAIITASASSLGVFEENPNYFSAGTQQVIASMTALGLRYWDLAQ